MPLLQGQIQQIQNDQDFLGAPEADQIRYLDTILGQNDQDYAKAPTQERTDYIQKAVLPAIRVDTTVQGLETGRTSKRDFGQPSNTNFFGDLANHAINAATGYQQDDLLKQSGQGVGAMLGDFAGGLIPIGAGTIAGAGAGSVIPGLGTGIGGVAGGIAGAGGAGIAQDLQAQRLEGAVDPNLGRAAGSGLIQGGLQAIPGVGQGLKLLPRLGLNVALQGAGAGIGSYGQQGLEQGTFNPKVDWERLKREAALGGAGGAVSSVQPRLPARQAQTPQPISMSQLRRAEPFRAEATVQARVLPDNERIVPSNPRNIRDVITQSRDQRTARIEAQKPENIAKELGRLLISDNANERIQGKELHARVKRQAKDKVNSRTGKVRKEGDPTAKRILAELEILSEKTKEQGKVQRVEDRKTARIQRRFERAKELVDAKKVQQAVSNLTQKPETGRAQRQADLEEAFGATKLDQKQQQELQRARELVSGKRVEQAVKGMVQKSDTTPRSERQRQLNEAFGVSKEGAVKKTGEVTAKVERKEPPAGMIHRDPSGRFYGTGLTYRQALPRIADNVRPWAKIIENARKQGNKVRIWYKAERTGETSTSPYKDISVESWRITKSGDVMINAVNSEGNPAMYVIKKSRNEGLFKEPVILDEPANLEITGINRATPRKTSEIQSIRAKLEAHGIPLDPDKPISVEAINKVLASVDKPAAKKVRQVIKDLPELKEPVEKLMQNRLNVQDVKKTLRKIKRQKDKKGIDDATNC